MHDAFAGEQKRAETREAMASILARYPQLDDAETERLVQYLRKEASSLDVALLSAGDETGRPYRQFRIDHAARFATGWGSRTIMIVLSLLFVLAVALLWDFGR